MLATLLGLGRQARQQTTQAGLRFLLVNETMGLLAYRQAAFWSRERGVEALSGVSELDPHAPYVRWLQQWCSASGQQSGDRAYSVDLRQLPASQGGDWADWLPPHLATIEMAADGDFGGGSLLLARDTAFTQAELGALREWVEVWSARYATLQPRRRLLTRWLAGKRQSVRKRLIGWSLVVAAVITASLPVELTVLAPAELVPLEPSIIRSPLDGVVDRMLVMPNDRVSEGQALFVFDRVSLDSQLRVAEGELSTVQAEYRRNAQRAVFDAESKEALATLRSRIEERRAEVDYLRELSRRSEVSAPRAGLALFADANEWQGRPVVTGERIMVIADERRSQIEAWLSPADMIRLSPGSSIVVYPAADPLHPLQGSIHYVAHQPELRPEGHYAYRVRASLQADEQADPVARVGLKGTAKLYGERTSLAYWILRRPLAALRGWIGL